MSDLISREKAVQGVRELFSMGDCYCDELSIIGMLNGLPSAELNHTAKVKNSGHPCGAYGHCSNCGEYCVNEEPYCPHCGCRLEWE